jgi:hypothetical protein
LETFEDQGGFFTDFIRHPGRYTLMEMITKEEVYHAIEG